MIYLNSRYADSEITYILDSRSGISRAAVLRSIPEQEDTQQYGFVYYWRDGDRLDLLAYRMYGASADWWKILDANPDIVNPLQIEPGTSIRIP